MKRLTYEGNFCDIAVCDPGESGCPKGGCSSKKVWERLKAYEDTGLTPEEVERLKDGSSEEL
jgi:hypothetical protein